MKREHLVSSNELMKVDLLLPWKISFHILLGGSFALYQLVS